MILPISVLILVGILITGLAVVFSKKRDAYTFYVTLTAIWLLASTLLSYFEPGELTIRSTLAVFLWCLSVGAVYAVVLGRLVASGSPAYTIWWSLFLMSLVQIPLSFISALAIGCYIGHSCP